MSGKPEAAADGRRGLPGRQPADRPVGPASLLLSESARRGRARASGWSSARRRLRSASMCRCSIRPMQSRSRERRRPRGGSRQSRASCRPTAIVSRRCWPRWRSSQRVVEQASDQGAGGVDRPVAVGSFTERGQAPANLVGRESLAIPEHDCRQPGGGETELVF